MPVMLKGWKKRHLVGKRFGRLVVVAYAGTDKLRNVRLWRCKCDCGKETIVRTATLNNGDTRSCGCLREEFIHADLRGKVFGRLTALEPIGLRRRESVWRCRCACGKEAKVTVHMLLHGNTRSCGCLVTEKRRGRYLGFGVSLQNDTINNYKQNAKLRSLEWSLTRDQALGLLTGKCHYCGQPPSRTIRHLIRTDEFFTYNGIDRKENALGYTPDNSVSCCTTCNFRKTDPDYAEFLLWIQRVAKHLRLMEEGEHGRKNDQHPSCE